MSKKSVRGMVMRSGGDLFFLPEAAMSQYRIEGDAAGQVQQWLDSEDVVGHADSGGALEFVTKVEFEASEQDDEVSGFRKAFDPLVGTSGYRRRCLNVIPADLLEIIERLETSR